MDIKLFSDSKSRKRTRAGAHIQLPSSAAEGAGRRVKFPGVNRRFTGLALANAEQKTEIGSSSSGKLTRIHSFCLRLSVSVASNSAGSRPVALSTKVLVTPSSSSHPHSLTRSHSLPRPYNCECRRVGERHGPWYYRIPAGIPDSQPWACL